MKKKELLLSVVSVAAVGGGQGFSLERSVAKPTRYHKRRSLMGCSILDFCVCVFFVVVVDGRRREKGGEEEEARR